jgi:hypothetical protein
MAVQVIYTRFADKNIGLKTGLVILRGRKILKLCENRMSKPHKKDGKIMAIKATKSRLIFS